MCLNLLSEIMELELDNSRDDIDEKLLVMLPRLKKLTRLDLTAVVQTSTVEAICQLQQDYKIGECLSATARLQKRCLSATGRLQNR